MFGMEVYVSTVQHIIWNDRMVSAASRYLVATNYVKTTEENTHCVNSLRNCCSSQLHNELHQHATHTY
jgi:hypothetical protein